MCDGPEARDIAHAPQTRGVTLQPLTTKQRGSHVGVGGIDIADV
jgi:hypothetical protein